MAGTRAGMRYWCRVGLVCLAFAVSGGCRSDSQVGLEAESLLYRDLRSSRRDAVFRASCYVERCGGPVLSPAEDPEAREIKLRVYDPPLQELQDHAKKVIAWLDSLDRDRRLRIVSGYRDFPWAPYFSD